LASTIIVHVYLIILHSSNDNWERHCKWVFVTFLTFIFPLY